MTISVNRVFRPLVTSGAWKATFFLGPKEVIRVTRKLRNGRISNIGNQEFILMIGRPNYLERQYAKLLKKAKIKFPCRKAWLKFPPKRRPA